MLVVAIWIGMYQIIWMSEEMKDKSVLLTKIKNSLTVKMMYKVPNLMKDVFSKASQGIQVLVIVIIIYFWGFVTLPILDNEDLIPLYIIGVIFIGIPTVVFLLKRIGYLNRILIATERMTEGTLRESIP